MTTACIAPHPRQTFPRRTSSASGPTSTVKFDVLNADLLFASPANFVFPALAGPNAGMFDWGLPFFFGRKVFTSIEGRNTPAGVGPYWAY